VKSALRGFGALEHFTDEQLGQLGGTLAEKAFPQATRLFSQGDNTSDLLFLLEGEVRARRTSHYGNFDLAAIRAGEILGELSFIDRLGRSNDVDTVGDCRLLLADASSLRALARIDAAFEQALYWTFWKSVSEKLRGANRRLLDFFKVEVQATEGGAGRVPQQADQSELDMSSKRGVFEEQRLSSMEINFLASLSKVERFEPGRLIFREGDDGDRAYIVVEGGVMISTNVPGAGEEALAFLGRGDYFGEMALIDGAPRSADAKADYDSGALVLAIEREVLEGILDIHKVSSTRLLKLLCRMLAQRLRETNDKLVGWYAVAGADPKARADLVLLP